MNKFLSYQIKIGDPIDNELVAKLYQSIVLLDYIFDEIAYQPDDDGSVVLAGRIPAALIAPFLNEVQTPTPQNPV